MSSSGLTYHVYNQTPISAVAVRMTKLQEHIPGLVVNHLVKCIFLQFDTYGEIFTPLAQHCMYHLCTRLKI